MPLSDFDADFADAPVSGEASHKRADVTPAQFAALPAMRVPSGYFTLTLTDGARKRFRIRLERGKFLCGHRVLAIHRKIEDPPPDAPLTVEWESVAVISGNGLNVFKRWRGDWEERWAVALWLLANGQAAPGYSLEIEPRCHATMRELKSEENKRTGLTTAWIKRLLK